MKSIASEFSSFILSRFNIVSIPNGQILGPVANLASPKRRALESGKVWVITATEIAGKTYKNPPNFKDYYVVATIEPVDLQQKSPKERRKIIQAVDNFAIEEKIDAIVEATSADTARANSWGMREAEKLREAGVIRCVMFDGGHHVATLPLEPDILLVSTTYYKGKPYASHWFTRDSVPTWKLRGVLNSEAISSVIAEFPRNGLPIKNPGAMANLAAQAILNIVKAYPKEKEVLHFKKIKKSPESAIGGGESGIRKASLFMSLEVSTDYNEQSLLDRVTSEIKKRECSDKKIEHVYIGLSFGSSKFPFRSRKVNFSMDDLENLINKRFPYKVTILSEPVSTWDIYLSRVGL